MIVKNKRTKDTVEVSLNEFKRKFAEEIEDALESYKRTALAKPYFRMNNDIEGDFYLDLQRNFNQYTNTNLCIERM